MAGKLLKETKDIEVKKKKRNNKIDDDNIYKIDLDVAQNEQGIEQDLIQDVEQLAYYDEEEQLEENQKAKTKKKSTKEKVKSDSGIRKIEDDDDEIDEIFGNVNKWLKDAEEVIEKRPKRRLTKIEEGIKSSKVTKTEKTTKKQKTTATNEKAKKISEIEMPEIITKPEEIEEIEEIEKPTKAKKSVAKKEEKTAKTRASSKASTTAKASTRSKASEIAKVSASSKASTKTRTNSKSRVDDIYSLNNLEELDDTNYRDEEDGDIETIGEKQNEIQIHTENDLTEIVLKKNRYKIELQKMEYNIYTDTNETSYIIVRDPGVRIVSGGVYILLEKQGEDYAITTNQDFKINYVIDNLERKNNTVNFKLTNLTEIEAYEDGLVFEIDEEKVIENNLEDNNTLVISEEDGKVYLPYTKEDIKNDVMQNRGTKISEVIEGKYILPLDKYKNSMRARFREGYNLMYRKEGKSKRSAIMLGIELMFETNLHPAIISACKNLEELDIYLDCLEDNELEKFSCFKIIYKSLPTLRKKTKIQEF